MAWCRARARKPILTRVAHDPLGHVQDRTPVTIPKDLQDRWLDPTRTERDQVQHFINTIPEPTSSCGWSAKKSNQSVTTDHSSLPR